MLTRLPDTRRGAPCVVGCTGVHSYTHDGTRWCWPGAQRGRQGLDVEVVTHDPPEHLARRAHGVADFWTAWTALEVVAKLTDTPALALFSRHGLRVPVPDGVRLEHERIGDTLCCRGRWVA